MDDIGGPTPDKPASWRRLRTFLSQNPTLRICHMYIRYYDNEYHLPKDKAGYYFRFGLGGIWGSAVQYHKFIVGYVEDGVVNAVTLDVPALTEFIKDKRAIDLNDESLIQCQ